MFLCVTFGDALGNSEFRQICRYDCSKALQIGVRWRKGAKMDVARLRKDQQRLVKS